MKQFLVILGLFACFFGAVVRSEDRPGHTEMKHIVVRPDAVKWGDPPPSLPPGCKVMVLVGDPRNADAPYVIRAKLPDGYKIPPHWHPQDENLTVLQGTLLVGKGEKLDPSSMEKLTPGSFCHLPKTMRHSAMAQGETIIQTHGIGPFEINYVNSADDPRKQKEKK